MSLKEKRIPNDTTFIKLKDFPDGEEITVNNCGINEEGRYGAQPYFITNDGEKITLPTRYCDYISEILTSTNDYRELRQGVTIIKGSRKTSNGTETATFEIK